jgi:SAM-dependent methyltransferase
VNPATGWERSSCALCGGLASRPFIAIHRGSNNSQLVRCAQCGLRRLDPRPDATTLSAFYGSTYNAFVGRTRARGKQWVWDTLRDLAGGTRTAPLPVRALARALLRRIVDVHVDVGGRPAMRMLDVGCGFGDLLIYFKSRGLEVQGTDLSEDAAKVAAQYAIPVHVGPIESAPFRAASFDVAVMSHSLEHLPDPDVAIAAVSRFVRAGGELHIAVPNGVAAGLEIERDDWFHLSWPLHFWFYSLQDLAELLARHGFEVTDVSYRMTWSPHLRRLREQLAARCGRPAFVDLLRVVRAVLSDASRRDVLRVVAHKRSDPA